MPYLNKFVLSADGKGNISLGYNSIWWFNSDLILIGIISLCSSLIWSFGFVGDAFE